MSETKERVHCAVLTKKDGKVSLLCVGARAETSAAYNNVNRSGTFEAVYLCRIEKKSINREKDLSRVKVEAKVKAKAEAEVKMNQLKK